MLRRRSDMAILKSSTVIVAIQLSSLKCDTLASSYDPLDVCCVIVWPVTNTVDGHEQWLSWLQSCDGLMSAMAIIVQED